MKNTDYILRHTLNNYQSSYSPQLLDSILSVVNENEKKRRTPIWLFALGLVAAIMIVTILYPLVLNKRTGAPIGGPEHKNTLIEIAATQIEKTEETARSIELNPEKKLQANMELEKKVKKKPHQIEASISADLIDTQVTTNQSNNIEPKKLKIGFAPEETPSLVSSESIDKSLDTKNKLSVSKLNQLAINLKYDRPFDFGEPLGCPNFSGEVPSPIFLETYISHDVPFRTLSDNSAEPQLAYINERNRTESASYSFHAGARVSSNLIGNIVLRIGLDYAQITEKFKVTDLESTREIIVRDADGNIISTTTEQGFRDIVNYNKFKSVNIPVSLGYRKYIGKMALSVHGGVAFNISSSHRGIILDSGVMPMARVVSSGSDVELAAFKRDLGLSAIGSIGVSYPLKEKIDFLLEPNFKFILDDINLASYPIHQHMFTVGLLTGIRYKF